MAAGCEKWRSWGESGDVVEWHWPMDDDEATSSESWLRVFFRASDTAAGDERGAEMWRGIFIAMGLATIIMGLEALAIEKIVMAAPEPKPVVIGQTTLGTPPAVVEPPREITPPEWAPWSLLSVGSVVLLYSFTIPQRVAG